MRLSTKEGYLVIDMPGQLELYNSDDSISRITSQLTRWNFRLCAVHLSDSLYCSDAGKFVAVILSALSIMINLEVPQINVLSKADLLPTDLPYGVEFFQELPDLKYLLDLFGVNFLNCFYAVFLGKSSVCQVQNTLRKVMRSIRRIQFG